MASTRLLYFIACRWWALRRFFRRLPRAFLRAFTPMALDCPLDFGTPLRLDAFWRFTATEEDEAGLSRHERAIFDERHCLVRAVVLLRRTHNASGARKGETAAVPVARTLRFTGYCGVATTPRRSEERPLRTKEKPVRRSSGVDARSIVSAPNRSPPHVCVCFFGDRVRGMEQLSYATRSGNKY